MEAIVSTGGRQTRSIISAIYNIMLDVLIMFLFTVRWNKEIDYWKPEMYDRVKKTLKYHQHVFYVHWVDFFLVPKAN